LIRSRSDEGRYSEEPKVALPRFTTYNRGQMPLPLVLAIDMTPSMRSEMGWEVAGVALGFVLLSVGLAALAIFLFRRRSSDLTLAYFSTFAVHEANGLMHGLFPEATYSSLEIPLDPGDRIVLYTDGILESMNTAREEFGKSRLKKFLDASAFSAAHVADALLVELGRWSATDKGRPQGDDITLLVLDFLPFP
jgi:hypothetical protein